MLFQRNGAGSFPLLSQLSVKKEKIPQRVSLEKINQSGRGLFLVPYKGHRQISIWTLSEEHKLYVTMSPFSCNFVVRAATFFETL